MKFSAKSLLVTSAVVSLFATSSVTANANPVPEQVLVMYELAVTGDKSATKTAFEELSQLRETAPRNTLVNAMLGSVETMLARDAWIPWKKLQYAEQGLNRMDKAIQAVDQADTNDLIFDGIPANIWIKTTVGCTFIEMPQMFDRLASGYELLASTIDSAQTKDQSVAAVAPLFLCAGRAAKQSGDSEAAKKYLNELVSEAPKSSEASIAKDILIEL